MDRFFNGKSTVFSLISWLTLGCSPIGATSIDTVSLEYQGVQRTPMSKEQILASYFPNRSLSTLKWAGLEVRTGEFLPEDGEFPKADIMFLHGFGDNMLNHGPLFKNWTDSGYRVLSFDFPSHGETKGDSINDFDPTSGSIWGLAKLAHAVEQKYRSNSSRPMILAGWSTGGLLALRMAQGLGSYEGERAISGLILLAPGVFVKPVVGEWGTVTLNSLTQDPFAPHVGKILPNRPALEVAFSVDLLVNGHKASRSEYPRISTLVILAGENMDKYIFTKPTKSWVRSLEDNGAPINALECPLAMHELDNEGLGIGDEVRTHILGFTDNLIVNKTNNAASNHCRSLEAVK